MSKLAANPSVRTHQGPALAPPRRTRASRTRPTAVNRRTRNFRHLLVRVNIPNGEQERALDVLEPLLKQPYFLSPGWLKVDPTFDPLRNNPRFKRLVEEAPGSR